MRIPSKSIAILSLIALPAFADAPCDYENNDKVVFQGKIQSTKLMKKRVFPYIDDTQKCIVNIRVKLEDKDKWIPSVGQYTFGPDMSQDDACEKAEHRAKVKVLKERVPFLLRSERKQKCTLTKPKSSCRFIYMNVVMQDYGKQKVRMLSCDDKN
tara:strand:- start:3637 stop:4101 length:465 start_codon:yes stop_codon:yes gene_type:complete